MDPATLLAIIQLATVLTPEAITLVNQLITAFNSSSASEPDKLLMLTNLVDSLKPAEPK